MIGIQSFYLADLDPTALQALGETQIGSGLEVDGTAVGNNNEIVELLYQRIQWPTLLSLFVIYFLGG